MKQRGGHGIGKGVAWWMLRLYVPPTGLLAVLFEKEGLPSGEAKTGAISGAVGGLVATSVYFPG